MFGLFTKNLETMEKTNKRKALGELDDINQLKKNELGELLGGTNEKPNDKKKRGLFFGMFGPGPCQGDMPQ